MRVVFNQLINVMLFNFKLSVGGYNDKQAILLDKILQKMTNLEVDPQRFEILKENVSSF